MKNNHPNRSKNKFTKAIAIISLDCETVYAVGLNSKSAWGQAKELTGNDEIKLIAFEHEVLVKTPLSNHL